MKLPRIPTKKVLRVLGVIGVLVSVYLFVAGGILLLVKNTNKDNAGFYATWDFQIEKDSRAIVVAPESIEIAPDQNIGDWSIFRIEALNNNPSNRIFIGIARKADVEAYLNGVEYDETTDFRIFPDGADFQNHPGDITPGNPTAQTFWMKSTHGTGTQTVNWSIEPERYWLVLMNEDVNAGLDMNIEIGTKAPLILIGGISHLSTGFVLALISGFMLSFSARTRNIVFPEPLEQLSRKKGKVTGLIR